MNRPADSRLRASVIDILERRVGAPSGALGEDVTVPTEVWLNGVQLMTSADRPIRVHEMEIGGENSSLVEVTLTLVANRVTIAQQEWTAADEVGASVVERMQAFGLLDLPADNDGETGVSA